MDTRRQQQAASSGGQPQQATVVAAFAHYPSYAIAPQFPTYGIAAPPPSQQQYQQHQHQHQQQMPKRHPPTSAWLANRCRKFPQDACTTRIPFAAYNSNDIGPAFARGRRQTTGQLALLPGQVRSRSSGDSERTVKSALRRSSVRSKSAANFDAVKRVTIITPRTEALYGSAQASLRRL